MTFDEIGAAREGEAAIAETGTIAWTVLNCRLPPRQFADMRRAHLDIARIDRCDRYAALCIGCRQPGPVEREVILAAARRSAAAPTILVSDTNSASRAYLLLRGVSDIVPWSCPAEELIARLRVRAQDRQRATPPIRFGPVEVDSASGAVRIDGAPLLMPRREAAMLAYLCQARDRDVPVAELRRHVWGLRHDPGTNSVAVHASRLRARLTMASGGQLALGKARDGGYRLWLRPHAAGQAMAETQDERDRRAGAPDHQRHDRRSPIEPA